MSHPGFDFLFVAIDPDGYKIAEWENPLFTQPRSQPSRGVEVVAHLVLPHSPVVLEVAAIEIYVNGTLLNRNTDMGTDRTRELPWLILPPLREGNTYTIQQKVVIS